MKRAIKKTVCYPNNRPKHKNVEADRKDGVNFRVACLGATTKKKKAVLPKILFLELSLIRDHPDYPMTDAFANLRSDVSNLRGV